MKLISKLLSCLVMENVARFNPHLHKNTLRNIYATYFSKILFKQKQKKTFSTNDGHAFQSFRKFSSFQILRYQKIICLKMISYLFLYSMSHFGNS